MIARRPLFFEKFLWTFFVLFFSAVGACGQTADLARLTHADSLIYEKVGNEEILRFAGHVVFRKEPKWLRCDRSVYYRDRGMAVFSGNVVLNDSGRVLRADEVTYFQNPEREKAVGRVNFRADGKKITCALLEYVDPQRKALALRRVVFRDSLNSISLFADSVTYWLNKDYGLATGHPKLVKYDSTGAVEIEIRASRLGYDGKKAQAVALRHVRITKGDVVALAFEARFFDSEHKVVIFGAPRIHQGEDQMKADTIEIYLKGKLLDRVHLRGRGKMTSKVHLKKKTLKDWISGRDIWLTFKNDTLKTVVVKEQAISLYHVIEKGKEKGVNQVLGDWLEIAFKRGKPEEVRIESSPGLARGRFYPPGAQVQPLKP